MFIVSIPAVRESSVAGGGSPDSTGAASWSLALMAGLPTGFAVDGGEAGFSSGVSMTSTVSPTTSMAIPHAHFLKADICGGVPQPGHLGATLATRCRHLEQLRSFEFILS
jgi:hypothetical protein